MSVTKVEAILTAVDKNFTSTFEKAKSATNGLESKMKSGLGFGFWQAVGMKAVDTVFGAISSNLDGAISRFDTLNNYPKVLESLGVSASDAEENINKLSDGIKVLPTTLDAVASQNQQIFAVLGDLDQATELTLALNNAMASGGKSAQEQANAINQWTQAIAKGKPDRQDWLAMIQTAPAQMDQLSKSILGANANQQDLYDAMQNGTVTMEQVNSEMVKLSKEGGDGFEAWEKTAEYASAGIQMSLLTIKASVQRNLQGIMKAIDTALGDYSIAGILKGFEKPIDAFGETIQKVIKGDMTMGDAMEEMLRTIGEKAKEFIPKAGEVVRNFLTGLGQQIPQIITAGVNLVGDLLIGIAQALPDLIVGAINVISGFIQGLSQGRGALLSKAVDIVMTLVEGLLTHIPDILKAGLNLIKSLVQVLWNNKVQILQTGVKLIGALIEGIISMAGQLGSYVLKLAKKIPEKIKEGIARVKEIPGDIVDGIKNGLKAKWDALVEYFKGLAEKLPKGVKKVLGIASPSKVFAEIGYYTTAGFAQGIESNYKAVQSAVNGLYSATPTRSMLRGYNASLNSDYTYNASGLMVIEVPVNLDGRQIASVVTEVQTADQFREARKQGVR